MAEDKKNMKPPPEDKPRSKWEIDPHTYAKALKNVQDAEEKARTAFPDGKPFPIPDTYYDLVDDPPAPETHAPVAHYYAVNDRPVKLVPTPDGGLDVLALDMRTGEFERDMGFLSRCLIPGGDVDAFESEASFLAYVEEVRRMILSRPR